jgi:hypothetical protein
MEANIKQLTITGQAAEEFTRPRRQARGEGAGGSRRKKQIQPEEDFTMEDDEVTSQIKRMAVTKVQEQIPPAKPSAVTLAPKPVVKVPEPAQEPATPTEPQKVVLKPPKQQRVRLQPKVLPTTNAATSKAALNQTRKARRIKLTMANLSHRFTRAKKVKEHTEKESVDSVRDYLVKKGVIQAKSKAPEKMLRSMYADFMLLKDQAL